AIHLCRGNQQSRWLVAGDYEPIARPIFQRIRATRLLLEYDDDRSGSFAPLRHVGDDKTVVLGLISTKRPQIEASEDLIRRITPEIRIRAAGTPGAQPSVRLCLFDPRKQPVHRRRKTQARAAVRDCATDMGIASSVGTRRSGSIDFDPCVPNDRSRSI